MTETSEILNVRDMKKGLEVLLAVSLMRMCNIKHMTGLFGHDCSKSQK